jgi:hypothetical protein
VTSARQIAANRKNARRSTGPRSTHGKKRSARNAAKHGLSLSVLQDPVLAPEVARLAAAISGGRDELLELAVPIAEAQVVMLRARRLRTELIDRALNNPHSFSRAHLARLPRLLGMILHAEKTGRESAVFEREATEWLERLERPPESALERHARALKEFAGELAKLDRYERRALSRRKFAIRRFDAAHHHISGSNT